MSPSYMPSELVTLIVFHLITPSETAPPGQLQTPDKVAIYATVSKDWQKHIKRHTFSSILLTPALLDEFDQIIRGPRRKYVRSIALDVVLDSYDERRAADMRLRKISRKIIDSSLEHFNVFF
jgi:hypothetical protein